jgi:hypothetical protein
MKFLRLLMFVVLAALATARVAFGEAARQLIRRLKNPAE